MYDIIPIDMKLELLDTTKERIYVEFKRLLIEVRSKKEGIGVDFDESKFIN